MHRDGRRARSARPDAAARSHAPNDDDRAVVGELALRKRPAVVEDGARHLFGGTFDSARERRVEAVEAVQLPVPPRLEQETIGWCREMLALSPFALRMLKASFNADEDGLAGIQQLAHDANLLFYMSEEAQEGRNAYLEKRKPDFSKFPRRA